MRAIKIFKNLPTLSFQELGLRLGLRVEVWDGRLVIMAPMWRRALSTESVFCKAVVAAGYLTEQQMKRAARRYRLGCTSQGGVIYWQTDHQERIHDGKIMYYQPDCHRDKQHHPTWVSALLQQRYQWVDRPKASHCLFGLHLVESGERLEVRGEWSVYCVVEAEKTAVIMSEWYPQYVWLATGGLGEVQAEKFRPLRGHRLILFPDTDPEGKAYQRWYEAARQVEQQLWWEGSPPIYVSPLLELHATVAQKQRKIDIVDYLFER
ncbi:hypothetical protein SAMN04487851_1237 [Prevotella sp. tc2-28]|uniref:DUF6371 domain-containing protein n=1 Tax=Prevotella sp. tc2-28 TaxID=1761888 RepID=UPI00089D4EE2|nr:DUF6371 domain-containing protein [Prevotella sp. tc2-28]SEA92220.1 hypothetical protein SAMN04487851_1237 [Prevotella sp. tc2-28]